jgi:hypothetical protein
MLRIAGSEVPGNGNGSGRGVPEGERKGDGSKGGEMGMADGEFAALMREFDARMKVLRTVVAAGEDNKDGIDADRDREGDGDGDREAEAEGDTGGNT